MTATTFILIIFPAMILLGSLALLVWAWRGKRLDDHPICRRCGFDLFGLPQGVRVCSECGADLTRRRALRLGNCRRRTAVAMPGALLVMLGLGWFGGVGGVAWRGSQLNPYKPVWWLALELDYGRPAARSAALVELGSRMNAGTLTATQVNRLVRQCLHRQGDDRRDWVPYWGMFLEMAHSNGLVSSETWDTYITQGVRSALVLEPRQQVRRGDPLPLRLRVNPARVGSIMTVACERAVTLNGMPLGLLDRSRGRITLAPTPHSLHQVIDDLSVPAVVLESLSEGTHQVSLLVRPAGTPSEPMPGKGRGAVAPIAVEAQWNLVPKDSATVELINGTEYRDAVREAIRDVTVTQRDQFLYIEIDFAKVPVTLGYKIKVRARGRVFEGSLFVVRAGSSAWVYEHMDIGPLPVQRVDVILEPCIDAAVRTPDITRICNVGMELKDVQVK